MTSPALKNERPGSAATLAEPVSSNPLEGKAMNPQENTTNHRVLASSTLSSAAHTAAGTPAIDANRRHPLGFETEDLPLDQLRLLSDALTTIANVVSGLQAWTAFCRDGHYTAAGVMLEDFQSKIAWEIDAIRTIAHERKVASLKDAEAKFDIVAAGQIWIGEHPNFVIAKLAALSADINCDLNRNAGGAV